MIYDKFQVVLLSTLISEKEDSTNSIIASYILEHRDALPSIGIKELANACHVGTGSISRFCRDIGLSDFAELKELLGSENTADVFPPDTTPEERMKQRTDHIINSIRMVQSSVDMNQVKKLVHDIRAYDKVSTFGMLKAQSAATDLQVDMLVQRKYVYSCVAFADQMKHIMEAGKDELIIIFSCTGSYFEYRHFRGKEKHLLLPKIWMICGTERTLPSYVNERITYHSQLDRGSHPFQLETVESIIAAEYASQN